MKAVATVILGLSETGAREALQAVMTSTTGIPLDVVAAPTSAGAASGLDLSGCARVETGASFSAIVAGVARWPAGLVLVIEPGLIPEPGCIPELLLPLVSDLGVAMTGARLTTLDGVVVEVGVDLEDDLQVRRRGAGGRRDDPRWAPTRDVAAITSGVYAVGRILIEEAEREIRARTEPWAAIGLALAARSGGGRVVCPAGAWAVGDAAPVPTAPVQDMASLRTALAASPRLELGGRVLVIDRWLPRPDHHAGEQRVCDVIAALVALGCQVTLVCASGVRMQPYAETLESWSVEVFTPSSRYLDGLDALEELARERPAAYELVIVPWPELYERAAPRVRVLFPTALLVYDSIDLHHVRLQRQLAVGGDVSADEVERYRRRELAAVRSADVTLAISQGERDAIAAMAPEASVRCLPLVSETTRVESPAGRDGLLFVGGFQHPPNVDGVLWFVREVLPLVRRERPVRLFVVGPDAPKEIRELGSEAVEIVGHVADLGDWYGRTRVFVSPLRFGAGIKGKNVQAIARGLPLVTTTVGNQGMGLADGEEALVRDDAAGFATAVVRLLDDDDLWLRMSHAAGNRARADNSPARLREVLEPLLRDAAEHHRATATAATRGQPR